MKGGVRAAVAAAAVVCVVAAIAAVAWWRLGVAAQPDAVTTRLIAGIVARYPGADVRSVGPAVVETALPSGVFVEVRDDALLAACETGRTSCSTAIDGALTDVGKAEAAATKPTRDALRPTIVGDSSGYRYGFLAEPFFATLEVRYAIEAGLASTFVTGAIAERLGLAGVALRDAAIAGQRHDPPVALERRAGPGPALYRVRAHGDPVAVLLAPDRLAAFGQQLHTRKLVCHVPSRGVLYVAAASEATTAALDAMRTAPDGQHVVGLAPFTVDLDAPPGSAIAMAPHAR